MSELTRILDELTQAPSRPRALATILKVTGSHYRRSGAMALLSPDDGNVIGALSGGCLDGDLLERTGRIVKTQQAELVTYDTSTDEDLLFGLGLGCGGAVTILLEPVCKELESYLPKLAGALKNRTSVREVIALEVTAETPIAPHRMLFSENECLYSTICDGDIIEAISEQVLNCDNTLACEFSAERLSFYVHEINPPIHLIICGAGPETPALVRFAFELGWETTVLDIRNQALERLPGIARLTLKRGRPEELIKREKLDHRTAVVALTHKFMTDVSLLTALKGASCGYVGLLGSRTRKHKILEEAGIAEKKWLALYAPTGLDIGAESPEEIALAVVAEIQMVMNQSAGGHLRSGEVAARRVRHHSPT